VKELERLEAMDRQNNNSEKLRSFNMEINNTHDKNLNEKLDKCLIEFVDKYDLDECEILHYLRKFVMEVKKS
jgi:hypothetical protein